MKDLKNCVGLLITLKNLVFVCAVNGSVSISAFASLVGVPAGILSTAVEFKISTITAGIIKEKHDKIMLLGNYQS